MPITWMTCENGGWCKLSQVNDPYGYGVYVIWCADAISRSATPADADLGAVLMNDQLLIVVIVIGLQIAFVAIARAFPAITVLSVGSRCAVTRCHSPAGANPARQLSLQPVAVGADDGGNDIG